MIFSNKGPISKSVLKNNGVPFLKCGERIAEIRKKCVPLRDFLHTIRVIFYDTYYKNHRTE